MNYKTFPSTGWQVSSIGMGCWGLGGQWGRVDQADAFATLERALEGGVNFFDTADAYGLVMGSSEDLLGRFLLGRRHQVFIATKLGYWGRRLGAPMPITHPAHLAVFCDASLHRLRSDYIDLYLCHVDDCPNPEVWLEGFADLKKRGKIRAYGISTDQLNVAQAFQHAGDCAAVQFDYSLLNLSPRQGLLPFCRDSKIASIVRGPLAQGLLTGKFSADTIFTDQVRKPWNEGEGRSRYLERLGKVEALRETAGDRPLTAYALRALMEDPDVSVVIPGAKSTTQVEDHLAALTLRWGTEDGEAVRAWG